VLTTGGHTSVTPELKQGAAGTQVYLKGMLKKKKIMMYDKKGVLAKECSLQKSN